MTSIDAFNRPSGSRPPPTRFVNLDAARGRFGARVDRLGSFLWKTDPLAEAVVAAFSELPPGKGKRLLDLALDQGIRAVPSPPRALVHLFEQIDDVPFWVDREQLDLGGAAFLRCGVFGLFALGAGSLPLTYAPPAANKPLAFSRRLVEMAPRRVMDTMRFQLETCLPGGLLRSSEGFRMNLRVRLVHAQMRRILLASGRWNGDAWGAPLNQADTAYANVLFSAYPLGWLRRLGFHFTPDESDALIQLWRYSGHLLGLDPALLPATEAECVRLGALYEATQARPDEDSRALTQALMQAAPTLVERYLPQKVVVTDAWLALARFFLGESLLDDLGAPKSAYRPAVPLLRAAVAQSEAIRRRSPRGNALAVRLGTEIERAIVEGGLGASSGSQPGTMEALLGGARRWMETLRS
jgi:hypothetical protein